ncbi:hypothetical protein PE067_06450 [Paracoccus sp. DMF-8]|uniref:hypothetical protein n=1 Tax=Paracoccus sp. DMF-8 TaxID=3019445 RepID=UPI0023E86ECF|nr:hypothetical protein [Paracoccus sp. DMF-8]MDF3605817.1 hypothetical protein [Paracoccus sp. DMF-8]
MRYFDFSSWQGVLTTLLGLALFALIGVGIRVLMLLTIQQRQQRMNRQINERLRTLIAAYKVLGGSFTGELRVDPTHLRDLRQRTAETGLADATGSDRARRIRDAVEAALSDIILLGTEEQVRLASHAASEMVSGRPVQTAELVVSLRDFIRKALDLEPMPADVAIPLQGPVRQSGSSSRSSGRGEGGGGGGGGMRGMGGGGMGMGIGIGRHADDGS